MKHKVAVFSYYSPEELTGIGKYNGELIDFLCKKNYQVVSFSNVPFYPLWKKYEGYKNHIYKKNKQNFLDIRTWVYIPESPGAIKKILSELSFFISSFFSLLINLKELKSTHLMIVVNPPFFLSFTPLILSKIFRFRLLTHIQDLQVDAAKELGLLPQSLCKILEFFEFKFLNSSDYISTISNGMKNKIEAKKVTKKIKLIPNWSDLELIKPMDNTFWLHNWLGIDQTKKLIVYSGNIGEKQGLEIVLTAAKSLLSHSEIHFVILGEGLYKNKLLDQANKLELNNITFGQLVPKEYMNAMLNSSYTQLIIQKSQGADLFLPSKLTNILAAGCASIITAEKGTSLYELMHPDQTALLIEPDSATTLVEAIKTLIQSEEKHILLKKRARIWAEKNLDINSCLTPILELLN